METCKNRMLLSDRRIVNRFIRDPSKRHFHSLDGTVKTNIQKQSIREPTKQICEPISLVGLVRMCAPAQMVELWKRNLNYGEARARHNYLC